MHPTIEKSLRDHALRAPERPAILATGRPDLSWRLLLQQIEYVANSLNAMGIGRNERVAIVLPSGPEMAVAFVAVASCATAAPLNPACRQSEFEFCLLDLKAKAVIVSADGDTAARTAAQTLGIPVVELSFDSHAEAGTFTLAGEARPAPARQGFADEHDIALVLHTSGTTSRPKIVPLTQGNLAASTRNHELALSLTGDDLCLVMMPLFHVHGLVSAVLASLTTGGRVLCTGGFDAPLFFALLEETRPTWFTGAPALYQGLLAQVSSHRQVVSAHSLRFLRSAAAPLPPSVLKELEQCFKVPVIESYGMTETAAQIASNPLPPHPRKTGSVGIASGPEVAIMAEDGRFLSAGASGEIVIRGDNLMTSYEDNPAANNSAFANGWFRTGDQGFIDRDGFLFITGRLKEIINRGGEKISPREVDEAILEHPDVAEVATFAVPHARLGEDMVAAVVLRENVSGDEKALREFVSARLAQLKLPSRILIVDQIPKGPTGKLQRGRLAEVFQSKLWAAYSPARDTVEVAIARIWAEVLCVEQVGIHDNFFTLGGDSLLATRVVARMESALEWKVPLRIFFDCPTVAEVAQLVHQGMHGEA